MWQNICAIYGARDTDAIGSEREWFSRKKIINTMILKRCGWDTTTMGSCRERAYFFDDTFENTEASKDILNSNHVAPGDVGRTINKLRRMLDVLKQKEPLDVLRPFPYYLLSLLMMIVFM